MKYRVALTLHARQDIADISAYIAQKNALSVADQVLDRILEIIGDLETMPERGRQPPELAALGVGSYRERFLKPYRIIYKVDGAVVLVVLVADGRRDMQALLLRRLVS